jgi:predicted nucleotidyltransferase
MRLPPNQARTIREKTQAAFGPNTRVLLFGSRADDRSLGGDIDLLVEVDHPVSNRAAAAARLTAELQIALGDQRIDIILVDPNTLLQSIHNTARRTGVAL